MRQLLARISDSEPRTAELQQALADAHDRIRTESERAAGAEQRTASGRQADAERATAAEAQVVALQTELRDARNRLAEADDAGTTTIVRLAELERAADAATAREADLTDRLAEIQGALAEGREREAELRSRLERSGAEQDDITRLTAQHDALHAALAEAQEREEQLRAEVDTAHATAGEREAALQAELEALRDDAQRARATSPAAGLVIDDELLAALGEDGEDRTLLAPEVRRERLVVMALLFIAVVAGVALVTGGLTDVLR